VVRKLGLAAVLSSLLLLASAAFAQRSHSGRRSYSGGGHVSGRTYSGGGARSFSGGAHFSGGHYYGGGYVRGGRGHSYGSRYGSRSIGIGFYSAPRYYYPAPYRYRYHPRPCDPPGFYDWEGYWHYYPGCAVVVYPPPYVVAPYPY